MFSEELQTWLKKNNATMHDALRALRPDGPLDKVTLSTACMSCGNEITETLRWFHDCEMRCPCGGLFGREDLDLYLALAQVGDLAAAKTISTIKFLTDAE